MFKKCIQLGNFSNCKAVESRVTTLLRFMDFHFVNTESNKLHEVRPGFFSTFQPLCINKYHQGGPGSREFKWLTPTQNVALRGQPCKLCYDWLTPWLSLSLSSPKFCRLLIVSSSSISVSWCIYIRCHNGEEIIQQVAGHEPSGKPGHQQQVGVGGQIITFS